MGIVRVTESFQFSGGTVDRTGKYPVIRGVLLCGRESAWKRRYLAEAFAGDRLQRYAGRPSFLNHAEGSRRRVEDKVAWVEESNLRHNADGMPVGDVGVNPKHPMAEALLWAAENKPDLYSMSHVADIDTRDAADGWKEVRECRYVESVDFVASGATTSTLFSEGGAVGKISLKAFGSRFGPKWGVKKWGAFERVCEALGDVADTAVVDEPPADAAGDAGDLKSALMAALAPMMDAAFESGDAASLCSAVKDFVKLHSKHTGKGGGGKDSDSDDDDYGGDDKGKAKEQKPDPWELIAECQTEQFAFTPSQLTALKGMTVKEDRLAFIREQKGLTAGKDPRSSSRAQADKEGKDKAKEGKDGADKPTGVEEARQIMARLSAEARGVPAK